MFKLFAAKRSPLASDLTPFERTLSELSLPILKYCHYCLRKRFDHRFPCKPFLREFHKEASRLEEILDGYGALKNRYWFPFREVVAAQKLFSNVYYSLLQVSQAFKGYRLLPIEGDFSKDLRSTLSTFRSSMITIAHSMIEQAQRCRVHDPRAASSKVHCTDEALPMSLRADRPVRHVPNPGKIVVYLSTKFLTLARDRDVNEVLAPTRPAKYAERIGQGINEEAIRIVGARFHNLESHYDTFIFESDIENEERSLPILRGHISLIYTLLRAATDLAHYYERHMGESRRQTLEQMRFPLTADQLLDVVFGFLLRYAREYIGAAEHLCRGMIKHYSEETEITVPIPNYRGFHVRPSTLIAKIVHHYGSTVTMSLDGQQYNAGMPLELFRANEAINAVKRRYIGDLIAKRPGLDVPLDEDGKDKLKHLFMDLVKEKEIILYDMDLPFQDEDFSTDETVADAACRLIKHYMSMAKVDVRSDLKVVFKGDNRALLDIKTLAENGYGEDRVGNNIVLPEEISYLRQ